MALKFDVEGYEDEGGNLIKEVPQDLDDTTGVFVHVYDPNIPEFSDRFWVFAPYTFDDWDDWWDLVRAVAMSSYGYELE